jgi:hypothetical protein
MDFSDIFPLLVIIGIPIIKRIMGQDQKASSRRSKSRVPQYRGFRGFEPKRPQSYPVPGMSTYPEPVIDVGFDEPTTADVNESRISAKSKVEPDTPLEKESLQTTELDLTTKEQQRLTLLRSEQDIINAVIMSEILGPPKSKSSKRF